MRPYLNSRQNRPIAPSILKRAKPSSVDALGYKKLFNQRSYDREKPGACQRRSFENPWRSSSCRWRWSYYRSCVLTLLLVVAILQAFFLALPHSHCINLDTLSICEEDSAQPHEKNADNYQKDAVKKPWTVLPPQVYQQCSHLLTNHFKEEQQNDTSSKYSDAVSILLRNGTVWDGVDNIYYGTDVLLVKGEIKDVGKGLLAPAKARVIELNGRVVTPGLVDMHR